MLLEQQLLEEEEEARKLEEEEELQRLKKEEENETEETKPPKLENSDLFDTEIEQTEPSVKIEDAKEDIKSEAESPKALVAKKKPPTTSRAKKKRQETSDEESEIEISDISDSDDEDIPLSYLKKRLVSYLIEFTPGTVRGKFTFF